MCCKDCKERHPACHGSCSKYKEFREKRDRAIINRKNHYMTARAGFERTLKERVQAGKKLGNMRCT